MQRSSIQVLLIRSDFYEYIQTYRRTDKFDVPYVVRPSRRPDTAVFRTNGAQKLEAA
jgi:hypothetical protein